MAIPSSTKITEEFLKKVKCNQGYYTSATISGHSNTYKQIKYEVLRTPPVSSLEHVLSSAVQLGSPTRSLSLFQQAELEF